MALDALLVLVLFCGMLVALLLEWAEADVLMALLVLVLSVSGIISVDEALSGLANQGVLTIACLFVVAQALQQSGLLHSAAQRLFSPRKSNKLTTGEEAEWPFFKIAFPLAGLSAFMNNTPLVVLVVPAVLRAAKVHALNASRILMPLSFVAILGGTCTLLGTSTNLIISGMLVDKGLAPLALFEPAFVGVPLVIVVVVFLRFFSSKLLPLRADPGEEMGSTARDFIVELSVEKTYAGIGKTVEKAGLRHLSGLFLFGIERAGKTIAPVPPKSCIEEGDLFLLTGDPQTLGELLGTPGLVAAPDFSAFQHGKAGTHVFEAVVSHRAPFLGKSVRESGFRGAYGAAILAISRHGERLTGKVGDAVLKMGDTLLLVAGDDFAQRADANHFFGVFEDERISLQSTSKQGLCFTILAVSLIAIAASWVTPLAGSFFAAVALVVSGCLSANDARRAIDLKVVLFLALSLVLGSVIERVGLAADAASVLFQLGQGSVTLVIAFVFTFTAILSTVASNQTAAVVGLPIALTVAEHMHVSPRGFVLTVVFAASTCFMMPTSYQTNLLVWGPGNYRAMDFMRLGLPLSIVVGVFCTLALGVTYDPNFWSYF